MSQELHKYIRQTIKTMQKFADRLWYPPLIGLLAALDNIVVIIPNDGILISSSMLIPKRWLGFAFAVAVGSTIGAMALASLIELKGLPWILELYPGLNESNIWQVTDRFFKDYGLLVVFAVAITPLPQQPAVILASLAATSLTQLALVIFIGRFLKFIVMAYLGSHAPKLLTKLWGVKDELDEVGIKIKK